MSVTICLAATGLSVALGQTVTLAWTHSVQKTEWQEVWLATPDGLVLTEARVMGSGAGMEPPPEARLSDGFYRWRPDLPAQSAVVLRQSGEAGDWRICREGRCATVAELVGAPADPVRLTVCPD